MISTINKEQEVNKEGLGFCNGKSRGVTQNNSMEISLYENVRDVQNGRDVTLYDFLDDIREGRWVKSVVQIRCEKENDMRRELKKDLLPCVTISGLFDWRAVDGLQKHSGLICVDMDKLIDADHTKEIIKSDPYTFATFLSASKTGLAVIVRIGADRHLDSYYGLEKYYMDKYGIVIDKRCKDVSRARFASCDHDLFVNHSSTIFENYITKPKIREEIRLNNTQTEAELFEQVKHIVKQVRDQDIQLGDDSYGDWIDIGFALADGLGEDGRAFFHQISSISSKYKREECESQYTSCLKGGQKERKITIGTFFFHARNAGVTQFASLHNTDLGNSQRLINSFGNIVRYCSSWKKWLVWNDHYGTWQIDDSGDVMRLARKTIQNIYKEASGLVDSAEREKLIKWGLATESNTKMQAMVKLAESGEGVAISPDDLDMNPWLLNCRNGIIDLRNGQFKEHDKSDLITKVIPVIYDPNAKCPKWLDFLDRIMDGNQGLISFLQRVGGYTLTGDTREQCFFILHGCGANGKSTFLKTIGTLLGDYSQAASFETFLSKKQGNVANNDIARMQGKRFISAVEAEEKRRLAENVIKQVTGKDVVAARFLYAEYFEFLPQFKIFLATNHKPKINCNDPAIWRRVKLIPFAVKIPEKEWILDLDEQLEAELSGILNWFVQGSLDWQKYGLQTPVEVVSATQDYRNEMDTINGFLDENCNLAPNLRVKPTDLYSAYKTYCELNGETCLALKEVGKSLNDKGYYTKKSNGKNWRLGIGLKI